MSDDLVERARHNANADIPHHASVSLIEEMADRIEELELAVRYEADLAQQALDAREELETKLAKAVEFIEDLTGCEWPYCEDAKDVLAELKGQDDERL